MAEQYRTIEPDMWVGDDWFAELPPDGKLLYIYLFTNPHTHLSGVYRLAQRTMANETGLSVSRVAELLTMFDESGKLVSDNGWRFVARMQRYQLRGTVSPQMRKHIDGYLEGCPSQAILTAYRKAYPSDTLSDGYREGIGSPSNTLHSTQLKEEEEEGAERPNIFTEYERSIGMLTASMRELLIEAEATYPTHWITAAFRRAVEQNARNWRYVDTHLRNWQSGAYPAPVLGDDGKITIPERSNGNHRRAKKSTDEILAEVYTEDLWQPSKQ